LLGAAILITRPRRQETLGEPLRNIPEIFELLQQFLMSCIERNSEKKKQLAENCFVI